MEPVSTEIVLTPQGKRLMALASWVLYLPLYYSVLPLLGSGSGIVVTFPVVVTASLLGMRAGFLAGLLGYPSGVLLYWLSGQAQVDWAETLFPSIFIVLATALVGAVVGRFSDMRLQLNEELQERRKIEEALREQRQLAESLREISLALTTEHDPEVVLDGLLYLVNHVVPYDSANIMLIEDGQVTLSRQKGYERLGVDLDLKMVEAEMASSKFVRQMADTHRPIVVADTYSDASWHHVEGTEYIRSWAGAPIIVHGQLIGFLSVDKGEPNFYNQKMAENLMDFAIHAGIAIENARLHAEQHFLATHDKLTGLPNRAFFLDRLEHALAHAERYERLLAILFVDLDNFKSINDNLGHHSGDILLQRASKRIQEALRTSDTVARVGGDEFALILENFHDVRGPGTVALKVLVKLSEPFDLDGEEVAVSASVGVSVFPHDGVSPDELLKKADTAMYRSKQRGRNQYQYFSEIY